MGRLETDIHRRQWRRATWVPVLIALLVVSITGVIIDRQSQSIAEERMRAGVRDQLAIIRAKLEGNISSNVQLVRGLVSTIATEPDMDQARFDALVGNLFEEHSQLRSIAAAPDLVVRMSYPLAGNERVIGLDYRSNPRQWNAVQEAVETGRLVLAGPLALVQGGEGIVVRFPVYTGDAETRRPWGVISAVIDVERLYADSGLDDPGLSFDLAIIGHDGKGSEGRLFYGPDLSEADPVRADVALPTGSWQLAAVPYGGWAMDSVNAWLLRGLIALGGTLILLPILTSRRMVELRHRHIGQLRARERQLAALSHRLNLALETSKVGIWELDLETGAEIWDERTNELYGLPIDGGIRTFEQWKTIVHPDDAERSEADFLAMIGTGRYESVYRVLLADGTIRHVRSIAMLHRVAGEPDRVLGVNWDITSDVALNEDLRRAQQLTEARNIELEAAKTRIEHNALHDSLTGLPNRRYLDEKLQQQAESGYLGSGGIALLHIDLDRFKQINDTLGHAAGDAMLIHASKVLRANCRPTDFVARIGGDEFVVVSEAGADDVSLAQLADDIVQAMRRPILHEGHQCRIGVSVGLATARGDNIEVRQLLINADIALYRAKARGRNRYEFFSAALQAEVIGTKRRADEILQGLDTNAFIAHYQPQFDAHSHDVVGVEALARWNHPSEGLKTPDSFMTIAEELSVVSIIDRMVLEQALRDLDRWQAMGLAVPRASVNVSQRRLHDEGLVESLRELDITPGRIAFELVESIYLDESDGIVGWNIDRIKDLGIDIEIDDFGTGYASIVSLQKLHPRRLKIDRQLVHPILEQPAQRRLLASIVDIGKAMGIEIVAEGVETMEHAAILRDLGCDILQGYAFARPMDRDGLERFLSEQRWRAAS
ncbi:MAG: EAL domain-containing protein [Devosia sp.]|nr:EAL domain-containing protein [Devosia sp.]